MSKFLSTLVITTTLLLSGAKPIKAMDEAELNQMPEGFIHGVVGAAVVVDNAPGEFVVVNTYPARDPIPVPELPEPNLQELCCIHFVRNLLEEPTIKHELSIRSQLPLDLYEKVADLHSLVTRMFDRWCADFPNLEALFPELPILFAEHNSGRVLDRNDSGPMGRCNDYYETLRNHIQIWGQTTQEDRAYIIKYFGDYVHSSGQTFGEILRFLTPDEARYRDMHFREFYLENKSIVSLPIETQYFTEIFRLNLINNDLTEFPRQAFCLPGLCDLELDGNKIGEIPEEISQIWRLRSLSIGNNTISEIPESILNCLWLKHLTLHNNNITHLPESFGLLQWQLETLYLHGNPIEDYTVLGALQSLELLSITVDDNYGEVLHILEGCPQLNLLCLFNEDWKVLPGDILGWAHNAGELQFFLNATPW